MFTPFIRFILLIFLAGSSIIFAIQGKIVLLIIATLLSLFILWDYAVRKTVPLALKRMLQSDYEGAQKALDYITQPDKLTTQMFAKYQLTKGMILHHKDEFQDAHQALLLALAAPLANNTLRIMAILTLTDIAIINKRFNQAKDYFSQLDGMSIPKSLLPTVQKLEQFLETK